MAQTCEFFSSLKKKRDMDDRRQDREAYARGNEYN